MPFGDHGQFDIARQHAAQFIESEQIGRVGHSYQQAAVALFQYQRAEAPRLAFRQFVHDFKVDAIELEIDIGNVELFGERFRNLVFGDESVIHQNPAQLASAALLLLQRNGQLFA